MYTRWYRRCLPRVDLSAGDLFKGRIFLTMVNATHTQVTSLRLYGSGGSTLQSTEVSAKLQDLMEAFGEARELIVDARESVGTTYFEEDINDAKKQTKKTLQLWEDLKIYVSSHGDTNTLERLLKEHELKMGQLKAELEDAEHAGGADD